MVRVLQDCVDDFDLPPCVGNGLARICAHQCRAKYDGKVMRVHAVDMGIIHDAVEVEREGAKSSVVWIGKAVDNGMNRVAADDIVVMF